jgi:mannose-6-phosphate isomerase-like protein (cupin superfamily)
MLIVDQDEELELGAGMLAHVPAKVRRQLVNPFSVPCTLVAIGAAGEHEGRDGEAFTDWSETEGRPPQEVPLPEDLP